MHRTHLSILLFIVFLMFASSCYYDKADVVYPPAVPCDTATVGFTAQVKVILDDRCTSCHGTAYASYGGGIDLRTYETVLPYASNGSLLNSILQNGKASAMPKGGNKLDDCSIKKVTIWIRNGSANN